jgi:hypothetical protein
MSKEIYRYAFKDQIPIEEVEATLLLSVFATEALHGEAQTRLDLGHYLDPDRRACVVDAGTAVGKDLARLFTGFLRREFADGFTVERLGTAAMPAAA